jgi:hypothetical protein
MRLFAVAFVLGTLWLQPERPAAAQEIRNRKK